MYKKILVGYDGSDNSRLALEHASKLAKMLGCEVWAIWVRESLPHYPETIDEAGQEREAAEAYYRKLSQQVEAHAAKVQQPVRLECLPGQPANTILSFADEQGADLIVLGHMGHSGLWGRLLGHTADRVSEHARCDVLIVRGRESKQ